MSIPFNHGLLVVNFQSLGMNELFGPFFGEGTYEPLRDRSLSEVNGIVAGGASELGLRRLALEGLELLWSRTARRQADSHKHESESDTVDWDARFVRAVELQHRDLRVLARARRPHSALLFAAQPFAPCCTKVLSSEERSLFEISDRGEGPGWHALIGALAERWPRYVAALRQMCVQENVLFADLSTCELTDWSFVDRVHMTDVGYRQMAEFLAVQMTAS
jgi:hypothetical protein